MVGCRQKWERDLKQSKSSNMTRMFCTILLIAKSSTFLCNIQNQSTTLKISRVHLKRFSKKLRFMIKSTNLRKVSWMIRSAPILNKLLISKRKKQDWPKRFSNIVRANFMIWVEDLVEEALHLLKTFLIQMK